MNLKTLQNELARMQKRAAGLESKIKSKMKEQFSSLPSRVGLKSIDHLIEALKPYASAKYTNGSASSAKQARRPAAAKGKASAASSRVRYSAAVKEAVKRELQKGGKTFRQLSKEYGPSEYSIKDWKKGWGLTKPRAKRKAA